MSHRTILFARGGPLQLIFCKKVVTPAATRGKGTFCGSWSIAKNCQAGCNPPVYPNIWIPVQKVVVSANLFARGKRSCFNILQMTRILKRILVICNKKNVVQPDEPLFTTIKKWKRTPNPKLNFQSKS